MRGTRATESMIDYMNGYRFDYFCGWRYLFSPAFRAQLRNRWGRSTWLKALCYSGVLISLVVTSTFAVLALLATWHLLNG